MAPIRTLLVCMWLLGWSPVLAIATLVFGLGSFAWLAIQAGQSCDLIRQRRLMDGIARLAGLGLILSALGIALLPVPDLYLTYRAWRLMKYGWKGRYHD